MANLEVLTRADNRYGTGDPLVVPKEGCSRRRARTQGRGGDGQGGNWAAEFGLLLSPCKMKFDAMLNAQALRRGSVIKVLKPRKYSRSHPAQPLDWTQTERYVAGAMIFMATQP